MVVADFSGDEVSFLRANSRMSLWGVMNDKEPQNRPDVNVVKLFFFVNDEGAK